MSGVPVANLLVCRVWHAAAGVTAHSILHAGDFAEEGFHAPKATRAKNRRFHASVQFPLPRRIIEPATPRVTRDGLDSCVTIRQRRGMKVLIVGGGIAGLAIA